MMASILLFKFIEKEKEGRVRVYSKTVNFNIKFLLIMHQ